MCYHGNQHFGLREGLFGSYYTTFNEGGNQIWYHLYALYVLYVPHVAKETSILGARQGLFWPFHTRFCVRSNQRCYLL